MSDGLGELRDRALADPRGIMAILREQADQLDGALERKQELDRAVQDSSQWGAERDALQREVDAIPEAHRLDAGEAQQRAACADDHARATRERRDDAQRALSALEARIEEAVRLRSQKEKLETRHRRLKTLTKLLGKDGLQGELVLSALLSITSEANAFLSKLTGGTLRLTIERGKKDEIELKAIDTTCMTEPRNARVLSGSQKFRCAVAIASGIGQYAGAGGMRSIVIDEGFGSLDEAGQQLMVDELKQLATHMDKVIVVSHLAAFADRAQFPDQILVQTSGAASRITRLA
jgi:exonuclease SbcC